MLKAGTYLNPHLKLLSRLGRGAMGEVWLAHHELLKAEVAIKLLKTNSERAAERFMREAQSAAQIKSPHVVSVFDVARTSDGQLYFVMERLQGEDLAVYLRGRSALSMLETADIITQLCRALSAAHAQGVVHRDIKPSNIFLCDDDGHRFLKVLDFGIAKLTDTSAPGSGTLGGIVGTPYFMAPEQINTPRKADHRVDLWAVGVVAYCCLAGRAPFSSATVEGLYEAISLGDFKPICSIRADLSNALDRWFERAFAHDPEDRFQDAHEMSEAFRALEHATDTPDTLDDLQPPPRPKVDVQAKPPAHPQTKGRFGRGLLMGGLSTSLLLALTWTLWPKHERLSGEKVRADVLQCWENNNGRAVDGPWVLISIHKTKVDGQLQVSSGLKGHGIDKERSPGFRECLALYKKTWIAQVHESEPLELKVVLPKRGQPLPEPAPLPLAATRKVVQQCAASHPPVPKDGGDGKVKKIIVWVSAKPEVGARGFAANLKLMACLEVALHEIARGLEAEQEFELTVRLP